jgi:hypothetical protein
VQRTALVFRKRSIIRIVTLLVRHGIAKYRNALEECDALFALRLPSVARDLVLIDNTLPENYEKRLGPGRVLIGGSNAHWEFSAWDSSIAYLGRRIHDYDLVHLATSAFRALDSRYLDRFNAEMLAAALNHRAAVGSIDYWNEPVTLRGQSLQSWLRSSFVFLPPEELRLLGSLASIEDATPFFSGNPDAPFRSGAPLSATYQKCILDWLTGSGTRWHSRFDLKQESLAFFEAKATAILNEQMLSARLRAQGCSLMDATWLATRLQSPVGQPLDEVPPWRSQIAIRDNRNF